MKSSGVAIAPVVIVIVGGLWVLIATNSFAMRSGGRIQGIIGFHYSQPEWGFEYRQGGERVEFWAFHVPGAVTVGMLLLSAVALTHRYRRELGTWPIVGLWIFHLVCGLGFLAFYFGMWAHAADVFI